MRTPTIIKPTVGRKVWYRASQFDQQGPVPMIAMVDGTDYLNTNRRAPLDATVIAVHGDRLVNLMVIDCHGRFFPKLSVTLIQEGDTTPKDKDGNEVYGYAEWMPYQTGQAKKASAPT